MTSKTVEIGKLRHSESNFNSFKNHYQKKNDRGVKPLLFQTNQFVYPFIIQNKMHKI